MWAILSLRFCRPQKKSHLRVGEWSFATLQKAVAKLSLNQSIKFLLNSEANKYWYFKVFRKHNWSLSSDELKIIKKTPQIPKGVYFCVYSEMTDQYFNRTKTMTENGWNWQSITYIQHYVHLPIAKVWANYWALFRNSWASVKSQLLHNAPFPTLLVP